LVLKGGLFNLRVRLLILSSGRRLDYGILRQILKKVEVLLLRILLCLSEVLSVNGWLSLFEV
jgi:hypothetical protein